MNIDPGFWDWKVGDLATWVGGIGAMVAAFAAVKAARLALRIAEQQRADADADRLRRARTMAVGLGFELRRAREELAKIADVANSCASGDFNLGHVIVEFHGGVLTRTAAISVFTPQLDCFGADEGSVVANACTGVMNVRAELLALKQLAIEATGHNPTAVYGDHHRGMMRMFDATCRMVMERVDSAQTVLAHFGGGITHWEVPSDSPTASR